MEEDWYFMEWVLAERNRELAVHEARAARLRSAGCEAKPPVPRAAEDRWGRRRVGDAAATGVGGFVETLAAGLRLVGAPHIRKHWRRPDGRWPFRDEPRDSERERASRPSGTPRCEDRGDSTSRFRRRLEGPWPWAGWNACRSRIRTGSEWAPEV